MKQSLKPIVMTSFLVSSLLFLYSPSQSYYGGPASYPSPPPTGYSPYSPPSTNYSLPPININFNLNGFPGNFPYYSQPTPQYGGFSTGGANYSGYGYSPSGGYSSPNYMPASTSIGGFAMGNSQYYPGYGYSPSQPSGGGLPFPQYGGLSGLGLTGAGMSSQYGGLSPLNGLPSNLSSDIIDFINFLSPQYGQPLSIPSDPHYFKAANVMLSEGNDEDEVNMKAGETLSIILPSNKINAGYKWDLDTKSLDQDVVQRSSSWYSTGHEQFFFEAKKPGTTTIKLEYKYFGDSQDGGEAGDTFEVNVTVKE